VQSEGEHGQSQRQKGVAKAERQPDADQPNDG